MRIASLTSRSQHEKLLVLHYMPTCLTTRHHYQAEAAEVNAKFIRVQSTYETPDTTPPSGLCIINAIYL